MATASAGAYYLTLPNNNASPLPSTTNLKDGAYVNYTVRTYENEAITSEYPITWIVSEGTYNGTDCWVIKVTADINVENSTTTTLIYWYMNKTTYECISMKTQTYVDDVLVSEDESKYGSPPAVVDPQTIVGQETITVPAGTFTCDKVVVTDATTGIVTNLWYSTDVPIVGLVKMETYEGTQLTSARELIAYSR